MNGGALRSLPSVDRVLHTPEVAALLSCFAREPVVDLVRRVLQESRLAVTEGAQVPTLQDVARQVAVQSREQWRLGPRPVINATGVILHTNLGRAPLSRDALESLRVAAGYSDLELDLATGERGSRQEHVRQLLLALTPAEAAHVVTNNAAGVMLTLAALARGKEVIVSRGQAVEIGGGFRVPVIMRQSGARLVEVGTTNRTRLGDYLDAITARTAAILHVHSSNFRIVGFSEEVGLAELASLAHQHDLLLIDDNGSGSLLDTAVFGLAHEPTPQESLQAGADVVAFSGDKLLGGPQAGILVGRSDQLRRIARHPMARAVRPDKMVLAALSATLLAYLRGDATSTLPIWKMIGQHPNDIKQRAERWRRAADDRGLSIDLEAGESAVGGGSLPGETLPTTLLVLPTSITAAKLREGDPAVVGRTQGKRVLLDLRTVPTEAEMRLLDAVSAAARSGVLDSAAP